MLTCLLSLGVQEFQWGPTCLQLPLEALNPTNSLYSCSRLIQREPSRNSAYTILVNTVTMSLVLPSFYFTLSHFRLESRGPGNKWFDQREKSKGAINDAKAHCPTERVSFYREGVSTFSGPWMFTVPRSAISSLLLAKVDLQITFNLFYRLVHGMMSNEN